METCRVHDVLHTGIPRLLLAWALSLLAWALSRGWPAGEWGV